MRYQQFAVLSVISISVFLPSETTASDELRDALHTLAERVFSTAKEAPVRVGVFSPVGLDDANSGPGLELILTDELNALKAGIVQSEARIEVKGDYAYAKSREENGLKVIKVTATIIDLDFAEELVKIPFKAELSGTKTIAEILQLTGSVPDRNPNGTQASKHERNDRLGELKDHPQPPHIHGSRKTKVSASRDSSYAAEIAVGALDDSNETLTPRAATVNDKGLAFVPIHEDEVYEPQIENNADHEVAVSATIDGVNVFHFSSERNEDGTSKFTHFIIPARSSGSIPGWFQKLAPPNNYLSFKVTGYGQGAITKAGLKSRGMVGVIHVQFSHCRKLAPGERGRTGTETGFGPPKSVKQQAVRYEIEPPHEFVTIRYLRKA